MVEDKGMRNRYTSFLNKLLDANFYDHPTQWVTDSFRFLDRILDVLQLDFSAKHPHWLAAGFNDTSLFNSFHKDVCLEAVFYYRLERAIFLEEPDHPLLPYLAGLMRMRTGMELYYSTEIGPGLNIQHGMGLVIGPRFTIGRNFIVHQGVTIGQRHLNSPSESIWIGDNVTVFAGAQILGNVRVGNDVQVGANAVLLRDAEPGSIYAGVPARRVKSRDRTAIGDA